MAVDKICLEARERFRRAEEAEDSKRKSILEAKQFRAGDQWDSAIKIARQGGQALQGQQAAPPRPCLVVDRVSPAVRQVANTIRGANFGIDVNPNGYGSDDETARIYKGIIRQIQNASRDEEPVEWAAECAAEAGEGVFRIETRYVKVPSDYIGPECFDQEIVFGRVPNTLSVYWDPGAVKPTKSDARWLIITEDLTRQEYKRRYKPKARELASIDEFMAAGDEAKGWVDPDHVRVAQYWRVEYADRKILELEDGTILSGDEAVPEGAVVKRVRTVQQPKVKCSTINAVTELDFKEWAGSRIPYIPILGEELNVDGKQIVRGVVQAAMDAQRMVNYTYSGAMEIFALGPKSPWVIAEGQLEGYKSIWQTANTFNHSYLPYKPIALAGEPVPPPIRQTAEAPIEAAVALMAKSEDCIKATTQIYDPGLGNANPREKSGRAILALQQQSELGNSNYLDNVTRALVYAGELLIELIPKIYDRPGRILQILGTDDDPEQIMVNQSFTTAKGGVPQAAMDGQGQPIVPGHPMFQQGLHKFFDLTQGQYAVTVSVNKQYTTRRQEGVQMLGSMIESNPQLLQIFGDIFFRDLDTPGAEEISERMKKLLPAPLQDQQGVQIPPQVQAQMQQAQKIIDELTAHVNQLTEQIKGKQIEQQGKIDVENIHADLQLKLQAMKDAAQIEIARITAAKEAMNQQAEAIEERIALVHTSVENAMDRTHELNMAGVQGQQAQDQSAQDHSEALEQGQQSADNTMAAQAQQAALQPPDQPAAPA